MTRSRYYCAAIMGSNGRLDPAAFRTAFFKSVEMHSLNVKCFYLTPAHQISLQQTGKLPPPNRKPLAMDLSWFTEDQLPHNLGAACEEEAENNDDDTEDIETRILATKYPHCVHRYPQDEEVFPRLKVVFDLDNTLLHALSRHKLLGSDLVLEDFVDFQGNPDLYRFTLPRQKSQAYYIKFRPGVSDFIRQISAYCDVGVHTNATKEYADIVMSIIDPDRTLFGGRVVARDDETSQNDRKEMSRLFDIPPSILCDELIIVDDRRDVWDPVFDRNIVQCNFYEYFDSRKEILSQEYGSRLNNQVYDDLDPGEVSLEDLDRQLPFLKNLILRAAQQRYAASPPKPTFQILQEERSRILCGVVCLMTGYNKAEQNIPGTMFDNGPLHRRRLEAMGAKVVDQPCQEVTHVLVVRKTLSTERAKALCKPDVKFVHNLWIYSCEQTWTKVDEIFFDAATLLSKWNRLPTRPHIDHWVHTKTYFEALSQQSDSGDAAAEDSDDASRVSEDTATSSREEFKAKKRRRNWDQNPLSLANPTQIIRSNNDSIHRREWLASGPYSDGAEIWSSMESVTLKFDPFLSSTLMRKTGLLMR